MACTGVKDYIIRIFFSFFAFSCKSSAMAVVVNKGISGGTTFSVESAIEAI